MITEKKHKEGYFIGLGIAMALPISVPVGMMLGNIALGPLITLPIGLFIGWILERRWNKNAIPLTDAEWIRQKRWSGIGVMIGLILLVLLTIAYFVIRN